MSVKRLTRLAVLTALALALHVLEAQIPPLAPIPGIKPGFANIVTVWVLVALGPLDAALILIARILLGSLFAGSVTALIYSLAGGTLCFIASLALRRFVSEKQLWALGAVGAIAHNAGQLAAASLILKSAAIWSYAPVLTVSAIVTGVFTGLIAQLVHARLKGKTSK